MQNNINDEEDVSAYYPDGDAENIEKDDMQDEFYSKNQKKKKKIKKRNSRLTKSQLLLIAIIFIVYTAIIFAAAWLIFYKPAHPGGEIPFETGEVGTYDEENPPLDKNPNKNDNSDKKNNGVIKDEYTVKDGVYNILVVGHDDEALLADVTMIVNVNSNDNSITVMQIPRDTLVTSGVLTNKINAAFNTFYHDAKINGDSDPYMSAVKSYEEMLEKSLCINIQYSVLMGLAGFRNIVDAMYGVDVYVPEAMYYSDPEQNLYINIPAGYQHLDGYNAECFVRFRSGYVQADLGRVNAQKIFLTAMFNKVKATIKSANVSAISNIASEIFNCVTTDMSVSDIIYFSKILLNVDLASINMTTIPGNMADPYYVINRKSTLEFINEHYNIYNNEISDSIFDKDYLFCFTDLQYICSVYFDDSNAIFDEVHNAEDIDGESIYIPRT